jgi:transcription elongation GreA/GreB family factor
MNKKILLDILINELKANLEALVHAALVAKEAATGEESKAENKYDTRGLEASYLAGAQAKRAEELREMIYKLQKINLRTYDKTDAVGLAAVVKVMIDDQVEKHFFVLPSAGGQKVIFEGITYHVITPESPVGSLFLGKKIENSFQVKINQKEFEYQIVSID